MSIIVPSSHTGIGAWVNNKMYTSIQYNIINYYSSVVHKPRVHRKLGNSVCYYITSRIGWVSLLVVILGQQYNVGEKPTVILYTCCINHHAKQTIITQHNPCNTVRG